MPAVKVTLAGFNEQEICTVELEAQVKSTVPVKPFSSVTVTVEVPAWPAAAADVTCRSREKSANGVNVVHAEMRVATSSDPRPVT